MSALERSNDEMEHDLWIIDSNDEHTRHEIGFPGRAVAIEETGKMTCVGSNVLVQYICCIRLEANRLSHTLSDAFGFRLLYLVRE